MLYIIVASVLGLVIGYVIGAINFKWELKQKVVKINELKIKLSEIRYIMIPGNYHPFSDITYPSTVDLARELREKADKYEEMMREKKHNDLPVFSKTNRCSDCGGVAAFRKFGREMERTCKDCGNEWSERIASKEV